MIDVHVLTHSGTKAMWLEQCLRSLQGQPCEVHVVEGTEGSVGAGRARGYSVGRHEFVAYVDSDDYLLPHTIAVCLDALTTRRAVVTKELMVCADGSFEPVVRPGHCLTVYRRGEVTPYLNAMRQAPHSADLWMRRVMRPEPIDHVGYVWRIHPDGNHHNVHDALIEQEGEGFRRVLRQRYAQGARHDQRV